ncbi:KinB signaling pathway activation protein [Paenibacillaceae bacterium GAS479]|nr:KinB signaling pathway activation protein [Paenibacillaceae bacterium GAS479]
MTIRKWFFLFWTTMAIGAALTLITGFAMQWMDQTIQAYGWSGAGFNAFNMVLVGLLIGAFSQMGFFAYLTLNYIALSVFRKAYLWSTLQAYTTVFVLGFLGYILYQSRDQTGMVLFWLLPILLAAAAWATGYMKTRMTNNRAFIPTLFLMIVVTAIEAWPSFQGEEGVISASAIWFMMIPLIVCNAYQILILHRITATTDKEAVPATGAKSA